MLWCSTKINMTSKLQTEGWLSVQVSSTSLNLAPRFPHRHPCAVPTLGFPPGVVWLGLCALLGWGVACPRILAQYKRDAEKAMAPHSSTLAWKIPWTEEPGRLQSMELLRVRHDWATSLSLFTFMHWRRQWQPTPVFLPGESQGQGSLVGCYLWGCTELDTTEAT